MTSFRTTAPRLLQALPLAAAIGLGVYGLLNSGPTGVVTLLILLLLAAALAVWALRASRAARGGMSQTALSVLLWVPALLILFFSFDSGGFFPDSVAFGALVVAILLVARLGLAERPLAAIGPGTLVPLVGIFGLAGWALLSQYWSHAAGRATIGADRDLLYALTFLLFASVGRTRERLAWALRCVALAMTAVAAFALISKLAPDVLSTTPDPASGGRLAYPLTYWNALGIFCAIAGVLCLHLTAGDQRRTVRVLSAGALPIIGTALLLTYSRGGLGAAVLGLALYAVLGRPRGLLAALIATVPATAIAMSVAYDATLISSSNSTTPAAIHQGHHVALVLLGCVLLAVVLRAALTYLDRWLEGQSSPIDRHSIALRRAALLAVVAAVVAALVLGAPGAISHRWNQFVNQQAVPNTSLVRNRLGNASSNGRIALWTIAMNAFDAHPIEGTGAETFEILWYEHRPDQTVVVNAHSLYIETLSDLGVVGLVCVALFVLGTLVGLVPWGRGRDRALYAALFSAGVAWAVHAGVDWDWQMPAVTLWFAALGGLAVSRSGWRSGGGSTKGNALGALAAGAAVVAVAVMPAFVLASQRDLNAATTAYASGNCTQADALAQTSLNALNTRAGPWQIEAFCAASDGNYKAAARYLRGGLAADPNDWQLQSALAAATAASGSDARSEVAAARRLDPLDPRIQALARALAGGPSRAARRAGRQFLTQQTPISSG